MYKTAKDYQFWKMAYAKSRNELTTATYSSELELLGITIESHNSTGVELLSYTKIQKKDTSIARTIKSDVFLWSASFDSVLVSKVEYVTKEDSVIVTKERTLLPSKTLVKFKGKNINYLKFDDKFTIRTTNIKTGLKGTKTMKQITTYGEKIGVISYKRIFSNGYSAIYKLIDIIDEKKWNSLKKT